jgi:hypothetical protein
VAAEVGGKEWSELGLGLFCLCIGCSVRLACGVSGIHGGSTCEFDLHLHHAKLPTPLIPWGNSPLSPVPRANMPLESWIPAPWGKPPS